MPDIDEARSFADAIHARYPDKLLAYNCSPSFNWRKNLDDDRIARFQKELGRWVTGSSSSPPASTR